MAAFAQYPPNFSGVALLHAELLQQITRKPPESTAIRDLLLSVFLGPVDRVNVYKVGDSITFPRYVYASRHPPCEMMIGINATYAYIGLSGVRTPRGLSDASNEYLEGRSPGAFSDPTTNPFNRPSFESWAEDYENLISHFAFDLRNKHIRIAGHSLGGAIAIELAIRLLARTAGVLSMHVCTFGAPKCWRNNFRYNTSVQVARWVNPLDNVPSLPPSYVEATTLYSLLAATKLNRLQSWRHPCNGLEVSASGSIVNVGDRPGLTLSVDTLQHAMSSPEGVIGESHSLETYEANLRAAAGAVALTNTSPIAPATPGTAPVPIPTNANVPAAVAPPPPPAAIAARRVAFAAAASARETPDAGIPGPAKMHAVSLDGFYALELMGFIIGYAPTKKKARACARHFNRFLTPFIGMGSVDSASFVYALAAWLQSAADPAAGFVPLLNDNGTGYEIPLPQ